MTGKIDFVAKVKEAVSIVLSPKKPLAPTDRLVEDLGIESIDLVDIIYELERLVSRDIDMVELLNFARSKSQAKGNRLTIQDIAAFLEAKS